MKAKSTINRIVGSMSALVLILALAAPSIASAKTDVTLSSTETAVKAGETFNVSISIAPSGETAYTSKVALSYPSDLLRAGTFSFAPDWLALSQPGYDSIDTVNGSIVKTGGYTKGVSSGTTQIFGTMTFTARRSGTAVISVTSGTQIYDSSSKNVYSGTNSSITVELSPAPEKVASTVTATPTITKATSTVSQAAAASTTGSVSYTLISIIILIALGALGYFYYRKSAKKGL